MKLNDYQSMARETAVYNEALFYPALGLAGEACELIEKCYDWELANEALKEVGDILWYVASVAYDAGLTLEECAECETFQDLQGFPNAENLEPVLFGGVGTVCEMVKKCFRDDGGKLNDIKRERIRQGLGTVLNTLSEICIEYNRSLTVIANENYDKLKSRQERGVLGGSGDNR